MTDALDKSWRDLAAKHAFGVILVAAAFAAIFAAPLWQGECPAYRDAGHFYFPTLVDTTARWSAGRPPLWNPYDNAGQPLAADATSAVFYPGRVILHLPIGIERAITLYVACHWLLAVWGVKRLAKRYSSSTDIQYFAAITFGLSGYVAGQCFNVVFLVGAAWLPWAWDAWESLRSSREPRKAAMLAIPLAMMVLGGDPQCAYHVALLALLDSISWRRSARVAADSFLEPTLAEGYAPPKQLNWPWFRSRWVVLALGCALAIGLAGVQVLPSTAWSLRCDRAAFDAPRSIWEWIARPTNHDPSRGAATSLASAPTPGTHDENLYDFSFAPVRLLELATPGIFGELGPLYQNWLKALTPSQRWWTSTNYLGLLTLGAAAAAIWCNWSNRQVRAAAYVAIVALFSSFGIWGAGSLWNFFARNGAGSEVAPAAGGLYWIWVSFLPGYSGFRYPSKWLVFLSLAVVLLAARGVSLIIDLDESGDRTPRAKPAPLGWLPHGFVLLAGVASITWVVLLLLGTGAFVSWGKTTAHGLFGPFDVDGALRDIRYALARTCCVSLLFAGILFGLREAASGALARILIVVGVIEVLLTVWHGPIFDREAYWMKVPASPALANEISPGYRVYRASSARLEPAVWSRKFDERRWQTLRTWEQNTLMPRYHWLNKLQFVEARGTMMSAEYAALLEFLHRCPPDDGGEPAWKDDFHPYDLLSARYCILPEGAHLRGGEVMALSAEMIAGVSLWNRTSTPPRAWIARSVALVPEIRGISRSALAKQTDLILLEQGQFRDLLKESLVESNAPDAELLSICSAPPREDLFLPVWRADRPEEIELSIELDRPGMLVLADAYDRGWTARRMTDGKAGVELVIFRANRVLRGVCLPAGNHRIQFRYRPWEIILGGVISLLTWLVGLPAAALLPMRESAGRLHTPFRRRRP